MRAAPFFVGGYTCQRSPVWKIRVIWWMDSGGQPVRVSQSWKWDCSAASHSVNSLPLAGSA